MNRKYFYVLIILIFVVALFFWLCSLKQNAAENTPATSVGFSDGVHLGFIHAISDVGDSMLLAFDDAVWLSRKEGEDAAIAAGLCTEETREECLPNDYYILNEKKVDEMLELNANIRIFMKTWNAGEQGIIDREINLSDFVGLINDEKAHWKSLPYNVTIARGGVARIEEVYIP